MQLITPTAFRNIITRQLLKTGQTTEHQPGDDGQYEAGWWKGRLNANNRTRFLIKTIGGDDVVLDRATGLMWPRYPYLAGGNNGASITWANAITYCNGLTFATFNDWRLPNVFEMLSIAHYEEWVICSWPIFNLDEEESIYWTSTTQLAIPTLAYEIDFIDATIKILAKTNILNLLAVRKGL